jgi:pimeloyl-ACP methyl ester carboxylesterase
LDEVLRTPEERFEALPDFAYPPLYLDDLAGYEGLRCHYLDLGPADASQTFLCLHGEPTWAFLFRRMIPAFLQSGARIIVPDLFGFGRSDKPTEQGVYTFDFHRDMLLSFLDRLELTGLTLVAQDWGGVLGLTLPMEAPHRFSRLLLMNTLLGTGDKPLGEGFLAWREWCRNNPDMAPGKLLGRACPHLNDAEKTAYDAPFPDVTYKAGARAFPELVPEHPDDPGAALSRNARAWLSEEWGGETFMAIGMTDPVITPSDMRALHAMIRGCPKPYEVKQGGHFLQEWGEEVASAALAHWE